jgi:ubiquinone/menaquinone biosynthesis C-methylase UbiE
MKNETRMKPDIPTQLIYRRLAPFYDFGTVAFSHVRTHAISRLELKPGDTVLDFGCGTGINFSRLERGVGPTGKIIGVDLSPDMLAKARMRVAARGWTNITLVEADVATVELAPASVDAVLSCYTNDIMMTPEALRRAAAALRPGGRYVATGVRLVPGWRGWTRNAITQAYSWPGITRPIVTRPWMHLERELGSPSLTWLLLGTTYCALITKPTQRNGS